ncbi:4'-phosphopantetheinyl transferase family protein [Steroidobacter cummioxidans]|uniref:4'-phosphopantetheinyl transferase family protein n=1 Tax=Steroidobacter cummioxidans TaxID=1803913 RepID=UPI00137A3E69|nr:4'-phosphopantetheinyl transferase superfamily protein [Steroidobacter cummioxidans]
MHGNPHALAATPFSPNGQSADTRLTLWLAFPIAREQFDPSKLSTDDRARLNDYRSSRRRADFEVSRALLAAANVGATAHSLSHSSEHAALFTGPDGWQIGVDLEINRPRDVLKLARFGFHEDEVRALKSAAPESRQALFYTLWTLKESFAKALQLELVEALRQCVFWKDGEVWHGRVPASSPWGAAVFQPRPDLFLAVAWIGDSTAAALELREWPPQQPGDWPVVAALR